MPKETLETIISELVHEEDWRRMRAHTACISGGPRAVSLLIETLQTGSAALKMEAAGMLARIKDPAAGVPLVRLLQDPDEMVQKAGVIALEQMAGVVDEEASRALVETLHRVEDETQREALIRLMGVIPTAIVPLTEMLRHSEETPRITAATTLEHLLDPRSSDALVDVMVDPVVRDIAVRTLKQLGAIRNRIDEAFDRLRDLEEHSEREEGRMATVIDLLGIGRPAVEILIEYLEDEDWLVREAAADLLGKIEDARAVKPLMKRVGVDKDTGVKELAIKALGLIGDSRPVDLLVEQIPIRPLRIFAIEALAKVKDAGKLKPYADLFEKLKTDRDGLVSYNSGVIVDKLQAMSASADAAWKEGPEGYE